MLKLLFMNWKINLILVFILAFILRFFLLGYNPPSIYWDEASLGYNSYTILTSGKDEHGEILPLDRFIAFGDFKPPGYIYATTPSIFLFGLNEFSIRFPSMLAGMLMVIITYLLVIELFGNKKLALLASFIFSISPWSIQMSRAAFESNLAALFNSAGVYFFILSVKHSRGLIISVIFFVLSFYTFNANRIVAPLLLMGLSVIYFRDLIRNKKWVILSIILGFMMIFPSLKFLGDRESKVRFQEVSIFNNLNTVVVSNERMQIDNNTLLSRLIHNRRIGYLQDFLKHYFDNFSGRFLFTHGDINPRLSIQEMGQLYLWELPFLIMGILILIKNREKSLSILLLWMLVAILPAGTAKETPHALRILSILPTFQIIIAYGIFQIFSYLLGTLKSKFYHFILFSILFVIAFQIFSYLHGYYIHYPRNWGGQWQFGYKEMVKYVYQNEHKYDYIFITPALGRPYIYFAFYNNYRLDNFLKDRVASRDWFGFWSVSKLGKINFDIPDKLPARGKILLVSTTKDNAGFSYITTVKDLSGNPVFLISERK